MGEDKRRKHTSGESGSASSISVTSAVASETVSFDDLYHISENDGKPICDDSSDKAGVARSKTETDVAYPERAERKLEEDRGLYRAIYDQSPVAIGFFDREGNLETANNAYLDIFGGADAGEIKLLNLYRDAHLTEQEKSLLQQGQAVKTEHDFSGDFSQDRHDSSKKSRRLKAAVVPIVFRQESVGYALYMHDVTRYRVEEQELFQERAKLLSVFENLNQIISVTDPKTSQILYANRAALQHFGDDMMEKPCFKVFHRNRSRCTFCPDLATLREKETPYQRDHYNCFDQKHYRLTHYAIEWIDGRAVELTLAEDITEQKVAEESLRCSEANFSAFFNTVDAFLIVCDLAGNIVMVNDTVVKRLGYSREELVGRPVVMMHPPERQAEAAEIVREMVEGKASSCPIPLITRDGKQITVETRVTLGTWNDSNAFFGVSKDISELRLSEEKFSKTFHTNSAPMALSTFEDGRFIDVNEAFLNTTGYAREEVIGKTSAQLRLFVDVAERDAVRKEVEQQGRARNAAVRVQTRSGFVRHGLFSAEPLYVQDTLYLLTTMNDVTDLKHLEQELRNHRDELKRKIAERTIELEKSREELEVKSSRLEEVNIALKVLLEQIREDKRDLENRFALNIQKLVLPYIEKVKKGRLDSRQNACLDIIETNLNEIVSPFLQSLGQFNFTPRETQIAALIKDGKTSKEIAEAIGVATSAVDTYRNRIRSKLKLSNKKINLQTYLQSLK